MGVEKWSLYFRFWDGKKVSLEQNRNLKGIGEFIHFQVHLNARKAEELEFVAF